MQWSFFSCPSCAGLPNVLTEKIDAVLNYLTEGNAPKCNLSIRCVMARIHPVFFPEEKKHGMSITDFNIPRLPFYLEDGVLVEDRRFTQLQLHVIDLDGRPIRVFHNATQAWKFLNPYCNERRYEFPSSIPWGQDLLLAHMVSVTQHMIIGMEQGMEQNILTILVQDMVLEMDRFKSEIT